MIKGASRVLFIFMLMRFKLHIIMCTEICQYLDRQATYKTCHSVNSMLPQPMFWHFVGSGTHESYLALSESVNVSVSRATRLSLKMLNSRSASDPCLEKSRNFFGNT